MKSKTVQLMALCLATALWAQFAPAQQSSQPPAAQPGETSATAAQPAGGAQGDLRLSKLMGAQVQSKSGEDLGKVEDLLVDPQTGKIRFAVLGSGGALGIGEKRIPVPWQALSVQSEKQLSLNIDKQKLESAPTLKSDYSDLASPGYVVSVYKFYEIQPMGIGGGETPGGMGTGMGQSQTNASPSSPAPSSP